MEWYDCPDCDGKHPFRVNKDRPCPIKSLRGGVEGHARLGAERLHATKPSSSAEAGVEPGPRKATPPSDAARAATTRKPKLTQPPSPKASAAVSEAIKPKLGRPRLEDRAKTLKAKMPWIAAGMSRTTWFRRQAEQREKEKQ